MTQIPEDDKVEDEVDYDDEVEDPDYWNDETRLTDDDIETVASTIDGITGGLDSNCATAGDVRDAVRRLRDAADELEEVIGKKLSTACPLAP
jgi:hypothetical protein